MEALQKVFERLDRKGDGMIDKDELMQQFDDLGCAAPNINTRFSY
jgi:Ca2+-binding EF-hand superfamily protein